MVPSEGSLMLVRYYGHVGAASGYGDAANEMCMAILDAGIDLEISTNGESLHNRYMPLASCIRNEEELSPPDVVIVHTLPMDCGEILKRINFDPAYRAPLRIAYTTWEGSSPMPWTMAQALLPFDQTWTPSTVTSKMMRFGRMQGVLSPGNPDPFGTVWTVPHACNVASDGRWTVAGTDCWRDPNEFTNEYTVSDWTPAADIRQLSAPAYRFYYIGAWNSRKNPEGVIRAYLRTFRADEPVELVIQSAHGSADSCLIVQLATGLPFNEMPTIRFSVERVSDEQIADLHLRSHCYVTASRGEAWNIPAFDAMLAGRHIISPAGLGSDDFLIGTSADRYSSTLVPAHGDVRLIPDPNLPSGHARARYFGPQGLTVREDWREPNIAELGVLMRRAYTERRHGLRVDYDIAQRFGRRAVGQQIKTILEETIARRSP